VILRGLVHRLLLVSFMLITLFFLLRDGQSVASALRIGTRRGFGEAGERVAHQAVQAIRGTVNGLVIVGFGEGLILGITYGIAGATHAALLGLLTGLLSAIPLGATVAVAVAAGFWPPRARWWRRRLSP
jgi:predicted PurR-regulated permease PerM